jgi:hypothetical protein
MKPFHEMTKREVVERLRSLYYAQPKADWGRLAVGNVIISRYQAWRITRIPPKRGFILAADVATGEVEKLLRSRYSADLLLSDEKTLAILRTNHRDEIQKAMAAGVKISPLVQYDYPEIFTPYPAEWDKERREKAHQVWLRINEMSAFHEHQDGPGWQFAKVDHRIEEARNDIVRWEAYRAQVQAGVGIKKPEAIPEIVGSVNKSLAELREEIEILEHLRKHLEKTVDCGPSAAEFGHQPRG